MIIEPKIFKSYDIRGLWPEQINEKNIEIIVKAIASFLIKNIKKQKLTVVLGCDMRSSSPKILATIKKIFLDYILFFIMS